MKRDRILVSKETLRSLAKLLNEVSDNLVVKGKQDEFAANHNGVLPLDALDNWATVLRNMCEADES